MAVDLSTGTPPPELDASKLRIAILCSRWNDVITLRLLDGARRGLRRMGLDDPVVEWVPGSFEIPLAARVLASSGQFDGVICLGAVIRGETSHYDFVAGECARGIQDAQLQTGIPVAFGVLTTENPEQALARSEDAGGHNVGEECAQVVVEMADMIRRCR
jgi:6,7-dimethyl-8-ribityllumazine synthase